MKGHQISYTVNRANIAVELFQFSFGTDSNTLVDVQCLTMSLENENSIIDECFLSASE